MEIPTGWPKAPALVCSMASTKHPKARGFPERFRHGLGVVQLPRTCMKNDG